MKRLHCCWTWKRKKHSTTNLTSTKCQHPFLRLDISHSEVLSAKDCEFSEFSRTLAFWKTFLLLYNTKLLSCNNHFPNKTDHSKPCFTTSRTLAATEIFSTVLVFIWIFGILWNARLFIACNTKLSSCAKHFPNKQFILSRVFHSFKMLPATEIFSTV